MIEASISHELGPDQADRFAFRFGNPELGPADTGGFVYLLDVALIDGLEAESLEAGTVLLSLPGTPRLEVVGPGVVADTDCVQHNRELLERLARGEVTLPPELDELAANLAG